MKNIILICCFIFSIVKSQNYLEKDGVRLDITIVNIAMYPIKKNMFIRNGGYEVFKPDWDFYNNALSTMQARFDYNHEILSVEYNKMLELQLVNKTNNERLLRWKQENLAEWERQASNSNLGNQRVFQALLNNILIVYDDPYIKDELILMQIYGFMLHFVKKGMSGKELSQDPNYTRKMYSLLNDLSTCSLSEIEHLQSKHGLD